MTIGGLLNGPLLISISSASIDETNIANDITPADIFLILQTIGA